MTVAGVQRCQLSRAADSRPGLMGPLCLGALLHCVTAAASRLPMSCAGMMTSGPVQGYRPPQG